MRLFGLLNMQGIAGLAAAVALAVMLLVQKGEARHWRNQSGQFEQLYHAEQAAFARTVADYRSAAQAARAADRAAADRVRAEQRAINERIVHEYEIRLAAARDRARGVQRATAAAAADSCTGRGAAVPRLPASACATDQAARDDRLPSPDALVATEQAIQLDQLIRWVKRQAEVDPNAPATGPR